MQAVWRYADNILVIVQFIILIAIPVLTYEIYLIFRMIDINEGFFSISVEKSDAISE